MTAIGHTDFHFAPEQKVYRGKVREVYTVGEHLVSYPTGWKQYPTLMYP